MKPIRFIHISDTHLGSDNKYVQRNVNSYQAFSKFLGTVKSFLFRPDFIIHTGDVTADCFEDGYKLMASMIENLEIPMYFATGNHDTSALIKKYFPMKGVETLSSRLNCYRFNCGGYRFFTIDGRGPDEIDPHGVISVDQMDLLKKELDSGKSLTIFIHYPALPLDSNWFDQNMLLTNGQELHQLFVAHRKQVKGVFFGHIHRSIQMYQDGILYASVGSTGVQFCLNPGQQEPIFESTGRGHFNIVTIHNDKIIIKEHSFANGQELYENRT